MEATISIMIKQKIMTVIKAEPRERRGMGGGEEEFMAGKGASCAARQ
jgi:hypothetical protein